MDPLITKPLAHADPFPQGASSTPLSANSTTSINVGTSLTEVNDGGIGRGSDGRDGEDDRETTFELVYWQLLLLSTLLYVLLLFVSRLP